MSSDDPTAKSATNPTNGSTDLAEDPIKPAHIYVPPEVVDNIVQQFPSVSNDPRFNIILPGGQHTLVINPFLRTEQEHRNKTLIEISNTIIMIEVLVYHSDAVHAINHAFDLIPQIGLALFDLLPQPRSTIQIHIGYVESTTVMHKAFAHSAATTPMFIAALLRAAGSYGRDEVRVLHMQPHHFRTFATQIRPSLGMWACRPFCAFNSMLRLTPNQNRLQRTRRLADIGTRVLVATVTVLLEEYGELLSLGHELEACLYILPLTATMLRWATQWNRMPRPSQWAPGFPDLRGSIARTKAEKQVRAIKSLTILRLTALTAYLRLRRLGIQLSGKYNT